MLIECEDEAAILAALVKYGLTDVQKKAIARYVPAGGTTSLCKELTQHLVAKMEEQNCGYVAALDALGIDHSEERITQYDTLPYYGKVLTGFTMGGDSAKYGEVSVLTTYRTLPNREWIGRVWRRTPPASVLPGFIRPGEVVLPRPVIGQGM